MVVPPTDELELDRLDQRSGTGRSALDVRRASTAQGPGKPHCRGDVGTTVPLARHAEWREIPPAGTREECNIRPPKHLAAALDLSQRKPSDGEEKSITPFRIIVLQQVARNSPDGNLA